VLIIEVFIHSSDDEEQEIQAVKKKNSHELQRTESKGKGIVLL
jgi:hypothetical protein